MVQVHRLCATMLLACIAFACGACSGSSSSALPTAFSIATIASQSGPTAAIAVAMRDGVDLAVRQHGQLGKGYTLTLSHVDATHDMAAMLQHLASNQQVLGIIGPLGDDTAQPLIPQTSAAGLALIDPTSTLPGLTKRDQATAEGIPYATLHPTGKPLLYFRLPPDATAEGIAAANVALATGTGAGFAAQSAFIVTDGSITSTVLATSFTQQFTAKHGTNTGHATITTTPTDNSQAVVKAIIQAAPDVVYYAGGVPGGAALRASLTLTGAPQLPILAGADIAANPSWAAAVTPPVAAGATIGLIAAPDPSMLTTPAGKSFVAAYQAAFPQAPLLPQSVMAYDAAMTMITAIEASITHDKRPTRAGVAAALIAPTFTYAGLSGTIAFDQNGDVRMPSGFTAYTCDITGTWKSGIALGG